MNKKAAFLKVIALVGVLMMLFTACGDKDSKSKKNKGLKDSDIYGTWVSVEIKEGGTTYDDKIGDTPITDFMKFEFEEGGKTYEDEIGDIPVSDFMKFEFKSDDKVTVTIGGEDSQDGKWKLDGDKVTVEIDDEELELTVDDDEMTGSIGEGDEGTDFTLKKD